MRNCVYRFLNNKEDIIYVGKAKDLKLRLSSHNHLPEECYEERVKIEYIEFESEEDMNLAERYFIMKWQPKYNTQLRGRYIDMNLIELDMQMWKNINDKNEIYRQEEIKINNKNNINLLMNELKLLDTQKRMIQNFLDDNNIDYFNETNKNVKEFNRIIDKVKEIEIKLFNELTSKNIEHPELYIKYRSLSKNEIIEKGLSEIDGKIFERCKTEILKNGFYKFREYHSIEPEVFKKDWIKLLKGEKSKSTYLLEKDSYIIDRKIMKEMINEVIDKIERKIEDEFGNIKKEVVILDDYYSDLNAFYPSHDFVKFQEPFIILKPVNN